ncbi:MAG TPA: hypothetical protein VGH33_00060 [Isosphaeraceae bacterium]|jgi:hypothetical protein
MCVIRFGGEEAEYLTLTVHGRSLPHSSDYWDGNWLACTADVAAGAFRGSVDRLLRNEDIARFHRSVVELHQQLTGEALFDTLDGWFDLRLIGDGHGHIEARGQLCDDPVGGNMLEFRLSFDQTYLPRLMVQLQATIAAFPIVGSSQT